MSKLKNVIIVNDFDYTQGGASKVAIDTANLIASKCPEVKVYFFSGDSKDSSILNEKIVKISTKQGEALKDKNKIRGMLNGIYNFKAKNEFKKLLSSLNKDETIIHVHGWTKCLSSSVFHVAFKKKYKVVLTLHDYFSACPNGGYFNYKKNEICKLKPLSLKCITCNCDSRNYLFKLYRIIRQFVQNKIVKLNSNLTDVISISDFSEKILKQTLSSDTKIHRVYNPIEFKKNLSKVDYMKNEYFLYVGRVSKEKGVDIFCEAISLTNEKGIVVGDGDQKEILKSKYPNIEFVGWKNSKEVNEYMKKARALIFTSRWYETMGLTILEAQVNSLPCIVSDNIAASDFISDKKNGLLFKNGDYVDLAEKITEFNSGRYDFKIENDFECFSKDVYLNNIMSLFSELIQGGN